MATTDSKKFVSLARLDYYDEKLKKVISDGDAATLASAKEFATNLGSNYDVAGAAKTVDDKLTAEVSRAKAREDEIAALANTTQGEVDALELLVGTLPEGASATTVVDYVDAKTSGIASDETVNTLAGRVETAEGAIDAIEEDYLKAADKTELQDAINAEAARADAAEKVNAGKIAAIEADYLKAADKTELQTGIDNNATAIAGVKEDVDAFLAAAEVGDAAVDTLKEIQTYITSDGEAAATMTANISQNASDIDALEGRMGTAEGKIATAEGNISDNATAIAAIQTAIADGGSVDARFDALEAAIGESGSVAEDIEAAKNAAISAAATDATTKADKALEDAKKYADEEDAKIESRVAQLETDSATHALASDLTALAGRVTTAEGEIDTLQSEMDTVEALAAANKLAHEANASAIALKASQADLDAVSGRVATLETWHQEFVEVTNAEIDNLFS